MNSLLKFIKDSYTSYTFVLVVGSGLVTYLIDYKDMKTKKYEKEAKISKFLSLTYIIGGILLYIFVLFID